MLIIRHTIETDVSQSKIWQVLQNVEKWNTWDHETEFSLLNGPFQAGTSGYLKPIKGPLLKTLITHVEPLNVFVQEAKLILAKTVSTHYILQVKEKTQITFQTEFKGPFAFFYAYFIGPAIKKKLPIEMEEMVKKAKNLLSDVKNS